MPYSVVLRLPTATIEVVFLTQTLTIAAVSIDERLSLPNLSLILVSCAQDISEAQSYKVLFVTLFQL